MEQEKNYTACKRTVFWFFIFSFGLHTGFKAGLKAVSNFLPQNVLIIADMVWEALIILLIIAFPVYVLVARYTINSQSARLRTGVLLISHQYVPFDSVLSVTTVLTPLSFITGFNFVVPTSPGAKSVMSFLTRRQAREISQVINDAIQKREHERGDDS